MLQTTPDSGQIQLKLYGNSAEATEKLCRMLEKTRFFNDLHREEVEIVAKHMKLYEAGKGATLFKEGDKHAGFYVIVKGKVTIIKYAGPYETKEIATILAGNSLGEMSLVDGQPSSTTAVTAEDALLLYTSNEGFHKMVDTHPALGFRLLWKIATMISLRLRRTTGTLVDYMGAHS